MTTSNQSWRDIQIDEVNLGMRKGYFTFLNRPYCVSIDYQTGHLHCECINGSNFGVNNKQVCKHKKAVAYAIMTEGAT